MTTLSDKSAVEHIQQRLCRQWAEVLLRGSFESSYSIGGGSSPAINQKSEKLKWVFLRLNMYLLACQQFSMDLLGNKRGVLDILVDYPRNGSSFLFVKFRSQILIGQLLYRFLSVLFLGKKSYTL
jgi:hypothetical protein